MDSHDESLMERLRDWDWNIDPLIAWFNDTLQFHFQEHGWIAILIAAIIIIIILLMTDATSYITELVLASAVRALFSAATWIVIGTLGLLGITTGRVAIAKFRSAIEVATEVTRKPKSK